MSQPISPQHPAVVLRSHYVHLRTLLAVAVVAVVALTVAVVILAMSQNSDTTASTAAPASATVGRGGVDYRSPEQGSRFEGGSGQPWGGPRP